jgi:hypothetical protein
MWLADRSKGMSIAVSDAFPATSRNILEARWRQHV